METVIDPVEQFTLSVSSSQGGSVNNEGGTFNSGTRVTITATPDEGFEFTGWSDSSYGVTNPLTIHLTSNTNITANFQPIRYTLTVDVVGQGQVSQVLGNESNTSTTVEYNQGDRVRLQTTPGDDWTFSRWQGDATGYEDTVEIVMDGSKTITATFDFEVLDDLVGAWDIESDSSSDKKIVKAPESGKDVICGFYALIFNPDYSFTLYYSLGTIRGEFTIEDPTTISLIGYGSITEISFTAQGVSFNLVLDTGCSSDITGEKDEEYDPEEPPKSFLERVVGSYWKMTSEDESYSKILAFRDNLPEEFGDMHDIDEVNQCISQVTNFNEFVEVVENYNDQLIYRYTNYEENEMEGTMSLRSDGSMQFSENYEDDSQDRIFTYYEITPEEFEQAIAIENCEDIDITAPVITLENASNQETTTVVVPLGEDYVEPGYTAHDDVDGDITQDVIIEGEIDTSTVGTYILNYFVEDSSGNIASTSREIIVQEVEYLVYFENGTCKCPNATVGETATISGTAYTVVDNSTIQSEVNNGNVNLCTTLVTSLSRLFENNTNFNTNINFWDTSNVTDMSYVFQGATSFNQDLSNWDTSNVTLMFNMFTNSSFNENVSDWDVGNVINMSGMFYSSPFNGDVSNWNVSNVKNMSGMFNLSQFNGNVSGWDVGNVISMECLFCASPFDGDLSNWDVSKVSNMSYMFAWASQFNGDISNWDVSNVSNMRKMFISASSFNQDIGSWDTSSVEILDHMFADAVEFNQDISNWNLSNAVSAHSMFLRATSFNQELNSWDMSNVSDIGGMFDGASAFNKALNNWDVSNVTTMHATFNSASSFNQNIGDWNVSNVSDMDYMFSKATSFNQDLSRWCVTNIISEPENFTNEDSVLSESNKPVWGTCASSSNKWEGALLSFSKGANVSPNQASNQDRITDNVWITRANNGGQIFNIAAETSANSSSSPAGTEWAQGSFDNLDTLTFTAFRDACPNGKPKNVVGIPMVLHLIEDDVYIEITFTSWSQNRQGGFSYNRSTQD